MDVEDVVERIAGGSLIHIHTSETISIESPSFESRQHVVVMELKVHDESSEIRLTTKLHLRYLEPSLSTERRSCNERDMRLPSGNLTMATQHLPKLLPSA
jgi:hypothetical protein